MYQRYEFKYPQKEKDKNTYFVYFDTETYTKDKNGKNIPHKLYMASFYDFQTKDYKVCKTLRDIIFEL